jgi:hypothetical protein
MINNDRLNEWLGFIEVFNKANVGRPTRIGVFANEPESIVDYWLESGLPLQGVDIDADREGPETLQIVLGGNGKPSSRNFTHIVKDPLFLKFTLSVTGQSEGLEISDAEGNTTMLRFEDD